MESRERDKLGNGKNISLKSNVFSSITQQSLDLQSCLFFTFPFKMHMPTKKYLR